MIPVYALQKIAEVISCKALVKAAVVKKEDGKWVVRSEAGKLLGTHSKADDAHKQLYAIEKSKERRKEAEVVVLAVEDRQGLKKAELEVEVADTQAARGLGLGKRAELDFNRGMFFDKAGAYWMKDVKIPLDILFLDGDGVILEKQSMDPQPDGEELKLYRPLSAYAESALETSRNWMELNDVGVGDRVVVAQCE